MFLHRGARRTLLAWEKWNEKIQRPPFIVWTTLDGAPSCTVTGGLEDHIYQQMPASDITCSLERYIEYALWLSGSSFTVGKVADCPVAKIVSPTSPTTAASHIPTSAATFPQARKVFPNSADLVAKLADPPIISLRKSMRLNSTLRRSRSTLNQRNESILVPKSAPVSSSAMSPW